MNKIDSLNKQKMNTLAELKITEVKKPAGYKTVYGIERRAVENYLLVKLK